MKLVLEKEQREDREKGQSWAEGASQWGFPRYVAPSSLVVQWEEHDLCCHIHLGLAARPVDLH